MDKFSIGQNNIGRKQVIDRQSAFPREMTNSAAKGESTDTSRRNNPARHRHPECVRRVAHVGPGAPAADLSRAGSRIDPREFYGSEIDHKSAVGDSETAGIVPAAA